MNIFTVTLAGAVGVVVWVAREYLYFKGRKQALNEVEVEDSNTNSVCNKNAPEPPDLRPKDDQIFS